jgi:flagellar hook-basal body complex protein FliE
MRIDSSFPIRPIQAPAAPAAPLSPSAAGGASFGDVFTQAVGRVAGAQSEARVSVASFLNGETEDLHKVALAAQRASIEFDLFLQVRNKVMAAYQEVMRSQI